MTHLLATDPNRQHAESRVTRTFVISSLLLCFVAVCLFLLTLPIIYATLAPVPFEYRNLPFTVCGPTSNSSRCEPIREDDVFHPGDVIPFIVDRCAYDLVTRSPILAYSVSRNVRNYDTGVTIILPDLASSLTVEGCERVLTFAHQLPESIAPGRYYLEGVATVRGRFKTVDAYFRTQVFTVVRL